MSRSFDVVGSKEKSVAIVEIRDEEKGREKEIAEEIMKKQKSVKSVLKKESMRKGDYRTRKYRLIAGDKNTEVLHKEYGYALRFDPQKVYFSVREGTERQRIAKQVKAGELVMVMFAGVGPYAIAIAKVRPDVEKIIAAEINPDAVEYMKHNIRINKLSHKIAAVLGDVRTACKKWYGKCDRVVMPLPLSAESFLDIAVKCAKPDGTIHFYSWGSKGSLYDSAERAIDESLKKVNREYKITSKHIVLPYAPGRYKVCVGFKAL
jgi:tRNA (guanine37-N1)-methyltransferase